jgi:putative membrane protein
MKRVMQFTAALAMALAVTACGGDDAADRDNTTASGTGGAVAGTTGSFDMDRDFVEEQLALGEAEIELGRLAQQKATHPDVKEYGAMMVREHQAAGQELKSILSSAGATQAQPTDRGADDRAAGAARDMANRAEGAAANLQDDFRELEEELGKLSGREFDRRYIDEMIEDHEEAVDDLEDKANDASHPEVKAWAAKTLPKVRQHLDQARSLKQTLENINDQR